MAVLDLFKRFVATTAPGGERRSNERVRASLGARVLVVDDSATIRAVLGKMLAQDGYEVLKAADGESAVDMAQTQFPDLIFLDIVLPGISGFAVLRSLRRDTRTRTTPIIMMSGNQQATEQFYVQRFGADGFVKKPFGRADVFHAIRSLVQAGRMPARLETTPMDGIPEGMTPEEWNAIPDVGMPDEAHLAAATGAPNAGMPDEAHPPTVTVAPIAPVERIPTVVPPGAASARPVEPAAPARPVAAPPTMPSLLAAAQAQAIPPRPQPQPPANRPVTVAVPVEPIHAGPEAPTAPRSWSMSATSVPMRPSLGDRLRGALGGVSSSMVMHVRAPEAGHAAAPKSDPDKPSADTRKE